MALEHAILVSLAERSATGYDLARRFDASIGHFWKATHQQVYKVLARMQEQGWVDVELVAQAGRPDRKVHRITDAGRAELRRWSAEPIGPEVLRSSFAVALRGLPNVDRDALLAHVRARRDEHAATLEAYEKDMARTFPDPDALDEAALGPYLVLRGGILTEAAGLQWCEETLARLEAR
jgi:DNA-binding PadR family transcriptional regulator